MGPTTGRQVRQRRVRLAISHHCLLLVFSMIVAKNGLKTQGRKRSFMAPRLEKESPDWRRRRGRHPVWKP